MKYNLPKKYLSWSQMECFEKSRTEYTKKYIIGSTFEGSIEMDFGKRFATAVENDDKVFLKPIYENLIRYDKCEEYIEAIFDGVKILGYKDTSQNGGFREYKTGKTKWTQNKVDKHGQLYMYSLIDTLNGHTIPLVHLDWFETKNVYVRSTPVDVELTGRVETFELVLAQEDIENFKERVIKCLEGITLLYNDYLEEQKLSTGTE